MPVKTTFYKASIDLEMSLAEIESLVATKGGLIYRVDQGEGTTAVFFSGTKDSAEELRTALSQRGKVNMSSTTQKALLKLP